MFVKDVMVQNKVGLHARPATFFIQKANEYKSSIWVEKEERRVNAKSLLGVLSLGIIGGTSIRIIADGADEQEAVEGLVNLVLSLCRVIRDGYILRNHIFNIVFLTEYPCLLGGTLFFCVMLFDGKKERLYRVERYVHRRCIDNRAVQHSFYAPCDMAFFIIPLCPFVRSKPSINPSSDLVHISPPIISPSENKMSAKTSSATSG